MDCEGEEYNILEKLDKGKVLERIDMILMEWHYGGKKIITDILDKNHLTYWCRDINENMGVINILNTRVKK